MKKSYLFKLLVFAVIAAFVTVTSCKDYDDDINKLQNEVNSLKTDLTSKIDAAKNEMTSLINSEISKVNAELATAKTNLTTLTSKVGVLETDLTAAKANIATLTTKVGTLEAFKASAEGDLATLKAQVTALENNKASKQELQDAKVALEAKITKLTQDLAALEASAATKAELAAAVAALEGKIDALETSLLLVTDALDGRVTSLEENSATKEELAAVELELTTKIGEINTALGLLDGRVGTLETLYEELLEKHEEDVADLLAEIAEAEGRVTVRILALEELLGLNEDGESDVLNDIYRLIDENAEAIEGVKTDLGIKYAELIGITEDLQDQIDLLDGRITVNEGAIKGLNSRMDQAEKDIKKINEETIPALDEKLQGMIGDVLKIVKNRLTSIALAPNLYIDGIEAIEFTSISYNCIDQTNENQALPTAAANKYTSAPVTATYKFNPRTFNLANADYQYVDRKVEVRAAGLPASSLVKIEGNPVYKATDGTVNFTLRRQNAHLNSTTNSNASKKNFITLEATLKGDAVDEGEEGVVIAAHEELVSDILLAQGDLQLGDNATSNQCGNDFVQYAYTFDGATEFTVYDDMVYNEDFDLGSRVRSCFGGVEYDVEDFNLHYVFSMPTSKYNITEGSTTTDQQTYFELVDGVKGIFKAKGYNKEAIGRTPIFKVEVFDANGCLVRRAFVKVEVGAKKADDVSVNSIKDLAFQCDETKTTYKYDVPFIRDNVYRILETSTGNVSISHEEFWNTYELSSSSVTKNGVTHTMTVPTIVDGPTQAGVATKEIHWTFSHSELGAIGSNGSVFVGTLVVKNKLVSSEFPQYVEFNFTVNVKWPTWTLDKVENQVYWTYQDQENKEGPIWYNVNVAVPAAVDSPASQAIFRTSLPQAYTKYDLALTPGTKCDGIKTFYEIVSTTANGDITNPKLSGVQLDPTDNNYITLDKSNAAVKAALNSAGGLQATIQHWYELNNGDKFVINTFVVNFVRPVNLNMPSAITVQDAKTGGDVADFHWNGILTDWRGEAIVAPEWGWHEHANSYWKNVYTPEFTWVDGHYVEVTPASLTTTTETVTLTLTSSATVYNGKATFQLQKRHLFTSNWINVGDVQEVTTPEAMLTSAQVDMYLDSKKLELEVAHIAIDGFEYQVIEPVARIYTPSTVSSGSTISFTNITGIVYTPAVTNWVPGNWVIVPHVPTPMPTFDGTSNGQVVGDWMWTTVTWGHPTWNPGQYWFFYGQFGVITAHVSDATTNLTYNNGQLPADVTLTQSGNTITYVNVGAPVGYTYEIYVPVTVTYGWGEVKAVFTITVLPSI